MGVICAHQRASGGLPDSFRPFSIRSVNLQWHGWLAGWHVVLVVPGLVVVSIPPES